MSLKDSLDAVAASAPTCRIEKLLNKIDGEDLTTLQTALCNSEVRPFMLTSALRKEYGQESVTDKSVADWRRRNIAEVNGL